MTSIDLRGGTGIEYLHPGRDRRHRSLQHRRSAPASASATTSRRPAPSRIQRPHRTDGRPSVSPSAGRPPAPQVVTLSQLARRRRRGARRPADSGRQRHRSPAALSGDQRHLANVTIADATGTGDASHRRRYHIDGTPTVTGTFSLDRLASQFVRRRRSTAAIRSSRAVSDIIASAPSCPAIAIGGSLPGGARRSIAADAHRERRDGALHVQHPDRRAAGRPSTERRRRGVGDADARGRVDVHRPRDRDRRLPGSAAFTVTVSGVLTVSPPSVDFGSVTTGSIGAVSLTITNTSAEHGHAQHAVDGHRHGPSQFTGPPRPQPRRSRPAPRRRRADVPAGDSRSEERDAEHHQHGRRIAAIALEPAPGRARRRRRRRRDQRVQVPRAVQAQRRVRRDLQQQRQRR